MTQKTPSIVHSMLPIRLKLAVLVHELLRGLTWLTPDHGIDTDPAEWSLIDTLDITQEVL